MKVLLLYIPLQSNSCIDLAYFNNLKQTFKLNQNFRPDITVGGNFRPEFPTLISSLIVLPGVPAGNFGRNSGRKFQAELWPGIPADNSGRNL